jgi:hypothetical protein
MMKMRTVEDSYQVSLKVRGKVRKEARVRGTKERIMIEEKEPPERSSINSGNKLEDLIVRQREEEVLEEDTLKEETLFPEEKEEAKEDK